MVSFPSVHFYGTPTTPAKKPTSWLVQLSDYLAPLQLTGNGFDKHPHLTVLDKQGAANFFNNHPHLIDGFCTLFKVSEAKPLSVEVTVKNGGFWEKPTVYLILKEPGDTGLGIFVKNFSEVCLGKQQIPMRSNLVTLIQKDRLSLEG